MLGIDPFETKEVEIDGVTFTIGHIIERKMLQLGLKLAPVRERLQKSEMLTDQEAMLLQEYKYDIVRHGVKGHKGFIVSGKDVPFASIPVDEFGARRSVASEDMLEYYAANKLLDKLVTEILSLSRISTEERKN